MAETKRPALTSRQDWQNTAAHFRELVAKAAAGELSLTEGAALAVVAGKVLAETEAARAQSARRLVLASGAAEAMENAVTEIRHASGRLTVEADGAGDCVHTLRALADHLERGAGTVRRSEAREG